MCPSGDFWLTGNPAIIFSELSVVMVGFVTKPRAAYISETEIGMKNRGIQSWKRG